MLLSDIYATAGYQGRAPATLLQVLVNKNANNVLVNLGALHRSCVWDNILLKADPIFGSAANSFNLEGWPSLEPQIISGLVTPNLVGSSQADGVAPNSANGVQTDGPNASSAAAPSSTTPQEPKNEEGVAERNAKALKHISNQIPTCLVTFFQGM